MIWKFLIWTEFTKKNGEWTINNVVHIKSQKEASSSTQLNRSTDHLLILFPVGYPVNTGDKNREWWPFSVMTHKFKQATGLINLFFMTLNIFHIPPLAFSTLDSFNKISYHLQDENSLLLHLKREVSNMSQDSQSLHLSVVAKMET